MDTITPLTAVKTIGTATSGSEGKQQSQQQYTPGQRLTATVLKSAGANKVYLSISGEKILASSDKVSLQAGTKLDLEILATKPSLELRIVSKTPELLPAKTLTLLGKNIDISLLFQSAKALDPPLQTQLSTRSLNSLQEFGNLQKTVLKHGERGAQLKRLIDKSGFTLESALAKGKGNEAGQSLKAALLEMASVLRNSGTTAETANRFLGTLEMYQLAQIRLSSENLMLLPLPLPFLNNGYLIVEQDKKQNKEEGDSDTLRFSLHLSLDPLGNLGIFFLQTGDGLYIQFSCESTEKKEFANEFQNDLKEMISSKKILGLNFTDTAEDPAGGLIRRLVPSGKSMLDTKI